MSAKAFSMRRSRSLQRTFVSFNYCRFAELLGTFTCSLKAVLFDIGVGDGGQREARAPTPHTHKNRENIRRANIM